MNFGKLIPASALIFGLASATPVLAADDDLKSLFDAIENGKSLPAKPAAKPAVPADDAVKAASAAIRSTFKDEFAKKDPKDKLAFAKTLRETAASESDPVQKYALYAEAANVASDAGSIDDALAAASDICLAFQADSAKEKAKILAAFAKKAVKPEEIKAVVEKYLVVANEQMAASDCAGASATLRLCDHLAAKAKDKSLTDKILAKAKEVAALSAEANKLKPSLDKLKESPDDPEANLVVGRNECLSKENWDKGLPLLAKSSDATLKSAAKLELDASGPKDNAKAADAWWTVAESEKSPVAKAALKAHASQLYAKALPELTGLAKATAEKRVTQAAADAEKSGIQSKAKTGDDYIVVDLATKKIMKSAAVPPDLLKNKAYKTTKLVMRRCPAGTFMMGETGKQHKVTLTKDFYIGVFEVTQGQWEKVMKANPSKFKDVGESAPLEGVLWDTCQNFCKSLNLKSNTQGFRLPTEAEWEYACRAGTEGDRYGEKLDDLSWCKDNSAGTTHEVGKKKPNSWGLYDMYGNVWEWCFDRFGEYSTGDVSDPTGANSGKNYIIRGGFYASHVGHCCSAFRHDYAPDSDGRGFRLALSADSVK